MTNGSSTAELRLEQVALELLEISDWNVRTEERAAEIPELAASLKKHGQLQPILVQEKEDGGYEILIGQRRFRAAQLLNWPKISAYITDGRVDELHGRLLSFSENVQRRDLTPREKSNTCAFLYRELKSIPRVAEELGISAVTVRKWLSFASVPEELKRRVDEGKISAPLARNLATHQPDTKKAVEIADAIATGVTDPRMRTKVIAAVEEDPNRDVAEVLQRAADMQQEKQITFILPGRWAIAMGQAERAERAEAGELARNATEEWLRTRSYL